MTQTDANAEARATFFHARRRPIVARLLKTPVQGGILTLTNRELVLGEGWLGSKNVRRFALESLAQFDLLPAAGEKVPPRGILLRFTWADGQITEVHGVGPAAAERIRDLLRALYPQREGQLLAGPLLR